MIRSWIHNTGTFPAMPAAKLMRPGTGWNLCTCSSLDRAGQVQDQNDMKRFELDI
jgi:hypothetical protein